MTSENQIDHTMKVILVGSSGVGKTSLISAYFKNPFENNDLPTVAPASCSAVVQVEKKKIELQIWDTAGQERFQAISQMFYRDSHVAFVCFDPKRTDQVENWVNKIRTEAPDCLVYLVATKSDILTQEEINEINQMAQDMTQTYHAEAFILTSAKTGNGVQDLFESAARCYPQIFKANTPKQEPQQLTPSKREKCC
ncbi:small GTP-binding protein, putative [Trichomonas vaginalis G3]|uniref:Small GTP-binding protein, putative n=2 Tax=Trichomonas vaginalis TaxID=5722 RepID=A0A8U0WPI2_TRIV3|nr:small Rab GTPase RabB3 [Trichomonas vaginalis G3]AAX97465.1 small Rab GTPase RabB3 [Trichomonas vaginalis]EAX94054.1 small GTP-binding protein, putative [Trichomonas vaginalis G3]KAI5548216.1 small Rab GTPase RabB3 [Trichomonas vaginalis G3]|eukprot:XP_001306984.1 small GTP-binding protein [Trichomonas vaginalis G3]